MHKYNIGFSLLIKINSIYFLDMLDMIGGMIVYFGTGFALFFHEVTNLNTILNNEIHNGASFVLGYVFDIVHNVGFI